MGLAIVHRDPGTEVLPAGHPVWRTCLREVAFLNEDDRDAINPHDVTDAHTSEGQWLAEGHAYRLLLEILCGLQSPMTGETQVLGQFKSFLASLGQDQAVLTRLGQRLLTDARDIRSRHLQGLGSRSYGSAVRRDLADCRRAVLIGTGKLAGEVLPFLADDGRVVDQWGRAEIDVMDVTDASPVTTQPTALIVAAPVPTLVVERIAARYPGLLRVIDLRADVGGRPIALPAIVEIIALQDLFARMHAASESAAPQIEAARSEISWRARQYELRDELRPFGWDDLCA